jgi:hypothetical protein
MSLGPPRMLPDRTKIHLAAGLGHRSGPAIPTTEKDPRRAAASLQEGISAETVP